MSYFKRLVKHRIQYIYVLEHFLIELKISLYLRKMLSHMKTEQARIAKTAISVRENFLGDTTRLPKI